MNFTATHTDANGVTVVHSITITLARFIKHFVLAGAGFTPSAILLTRGIGALAWYWDFVEPVASGHDCFGEPVPVLRDPSLKAHFSNLTGRAFADFMGRHIANSWVTLSYEGVLEQNGFPIVGPRPDLLAVNPLSVVALEAKGYSKKSVSNAEMAVHKHQASQGRLNRHAWAASVAYGLYDKVKVKYLDPEDNAPAPSFKTMRRYLERYFLEVESAAGQLGGSTRIIDGRRLEAVPLTELVRGQFPFDVDRSGVLNKVMLLIDRNVVAIASERLDRISIIQEQGREAAEQLQLIDSDTVFIDCDGIGISIDG
jgi:hypothetical protein